MRRPTPDAVAAAARVAQLVAQGGEVPRPDIAAAVRTSLALLAGTHPGKLVEVRVPPFAAVQVGVPGQVSAHTRGTPPHVIETDAATWLALATGRLEWASAVGDHRVNASGIHADLSGHLAGVVSVLGEGPQGRVCDTSE